MAKVTRVIEEDVERIGNEMASSLERMAGATVLVTGAAGFLCSYLVDLMAYANRSLLSRPCRLIAVDNLQSGLPVRIEHLRAAPGIELRSHDARYPMTFAGTVDYIIHGASIASPVFYRRFPLQTIDDNVTGTRLMLHQARQG